MRLSKKLFFVLIALLPINLGKHFEVLDSYVWGILSDYLVPTIYTQDLLIVGILACWILEKGLPDKKKLLSFFSFKVFGVVTLFLFSMLLSVLISERFVPSFSIFLRVLLYAALFLFTVYEIVPENDFPNIVNILCFDIIFLSILSVAQFVKQGAIFNNYLFFGEQPYSSNTWGISREYFFGTILIPSYGLFRHPNIFGGFLSVILIWLIPYFKKNMLYKIAFFSGVLALLLTFSFVALGALLLGIALFYYINRFPLVKEVKKKAVLLAITIVFLITLIIPKFTESKHPSLFRRGDLFTLSLRSVSENPFYGVGPGNLISRLGDISFYQPVHNIFLLILSESGVFTFIFFIMLLFLGIRNLINPSYFFVFLISLLQIVLIGTLDHYFWTIHQTLLLFWIVLGFSFSERYS